MFESPIQKANVPVDLMHLTFTDLEQPEQTVSAVTEAALIAFQRPNDGQVEVMLQVGPPQEAAELLAAISITLLKHYPVEGGALLLRAMTAVHRLQVDGRI